MDVMDNCEIISLDDANLSYEMEDAVIEADESDELWDSQEAHEDLQMKFRPTMAKYI